MARGRKRKLRQRYGNGQPVRQAAAAADRGTPEMQTMRQRITRDQRLSPDYPLSVLLGHGLITEIQHDAGMKFARNYWTLFGKPFGHLQDYRQTASGAGMTVSAELAVRAQYEAEVGALAVLGAVTTITDLAVFLRFDGLLKAVIGRAVRGAGAERRLDRIRAALEALANLFVTRPRREERERAERELAQIR